MNGLARWAVPLFFMISGYFCYGKGMDTVRRRIQRTWRLFLCANGVYFLWKLLDLAGKGSLSAGAVAALFSPEALFKWLVWNESPFMGHLWFLGALLYCYLFYGLLVKKGLEEKVYGLIPLCLAANLALGEGLAILGVRLSFLYSRNFWFLGLPFFLWGHWIRGKQEKGELKIRNSSCFAALLLGAVLSMAEMLASGGRDLYVGSILMTAGIFLFAIWNPHLGRGSVLAAIGERDSLHIYLWQMLLFDLMAAGARTCGLAGHMVYQWVRPLLACLLSLLLAELIRSCGKRLK